MHRTTLLNLLDRYEPHVPEEIISKQNMISFVEQNSDCFERSLLIGHMTASAWLVDTTNTHTLLTLHAKFDEWLQLGGHCDGDSDVLSVALKEAREESGIQSITPVMSEIFDIDIHPIPANSRDPGHFHYDVRFLLQVTSNETIVQSLESKDLRWFSKDLSTFPTRHPSMLRMFNKWLSI